MQHASQYNKLAAQNKFALNSDAYKKTVAEGFNKAAKRYDQFALVQQDIAEYSLGLFDKHLCLASSENEPVNQQACLLDIGCGTAKSAPRLIKNAKRFIGVDISNEMLLAAGKYVNEAQIAKSCFINADMENLPLMNESVQGVYSSMALQWCKSPTLALQELERVLAPKGKAMLAIMVGESFDSLHSAWGSIDKPSRVNRFHNTQQWMNAAEACQWHFTHQQKSFSTYHRSLLDLLHSMKNIGATTRNTAAYKAADLQTRLISKNISRLSPSEHQQSTVHKPSTFLSKQEINAVSSYLRRQKPNNELLELEYSLLFLSIEKT